MVDAEHVGQRVLAAFDEGRQIAIELAKARGVKTRQRVRRELDLDILEGHKPRGRSGRIAKRLRRTGHPIGERQVRKILELLFSSSDSMGSTGNL